jgi:flagellar hook assembly protein FlgD
VKDINNGSFVPKVSPNPYKKYASFDNLTDSRDHKLKFFNLPARGRLTILDVAGQIVDQIQFDNQTGVSDVTWDMFSKDGNEIANGLYIFVVEGGVGTSGTDKKFTYIGKFAVLR